jgi:hypothetical protein
VTGGVDAPPELRWHRKREASSIFAACSTQRPMSPEKPEPRERRSNRDAKSEISLRNSGMASVLEILVSVNVKRADRGAPASGRKARDP